MVDTKQDIKISEEMKLEKKIEDMQQQLHDLRYGDMEKAYKEFEQAKEVAIKKYNVWKQAALKHGQAPKNMLVYCNSWTL